MTLASYTITYHINDCYSVKELSNFHSKFQLLFQKFESKIQQMNLLIVDSVFPNILADIALEVLVNKIETFNQYINSKEKIKIIDNQQERSYFKYKLYNFIHLLLYSEIALNELCNGETFMNKVYCFINDTGEYEFYSALERNKLQLLLLKKIKLEIDLNSSSISRHQVKLCLMIKVN